jgi:hypothetical protein
MHWGKSGDDFGLSDLDENFIPYGIILWKVCLPESDKEKKILWRVGQEREEEKRRWALFAAKLGAAEELAWTWGQSNQRQDTKDRNEKRQRQRSGKRQRNKEKWLE